MNATAAEVSLYSETQQLVLEILPYFSAPFSALGSGLILYVTLKERKSRLKEVYHRLMLGLSSVDFLSSMSLIVLGPWAVPKQVKFTQLASGTFTTCAVSGFFLNFTFGAMWYSFFLALYFLLRIRYEWTNRRISRCVEPVGHCLGILFPVITGIRAVVKDWMNPMGQLPGFCWVSTYPPGCRQIHKDACLRGGDIQSFGDMLVIILLWVGIILCMVLLVLKVRNTERRIRNYAGGRNATLEQTKQTGIQALLYIGAFFFVYFPIAAVMSLGDDFDDSSRRGVFFAFALLTKLLSPLQGFFNAFIYFRRSFRSLTEPGQSLAFLRFLWGKAPTATETATNTHTARSEDPAASNLPNSQTSLSKESRS